MFNGSPLNPEVLDNAFTWKRDQSRPVFFPAQYKVSPVGICEATIVAPRHKGIFFFIILGFRRLEFRNIVNVLIEVLYTRVPILSSDLHTKALARVAP